MTPRSDQLVWIRRLYEELGPALLVYARSIAADPSAAEDALHQVFLRLLSGEGSMPAEPRPYLFRAIRNAALNTRRAARATGTATEPIFEAPAGREEARLALEDALSTLPSDQREVVVLKVWSGMTFEEAADLLGISANTAASRYRYAIEKLRDRLASFVRE